MGPPRPSVVLAAGTALVAAAAVLSLGFGVVEVPASEVARVLLGGGEPGSRTLVAEMRLPRALGAICVGGALGAAGCLLQAVLRNPLASPSVIGTAQAAALGKVLAVLLGLSGAGAVGLSFAAALAAALAVLALAREQWSLATDSVVLIGVNVALLCGALAGLGQAMARDEGERTRMALLLLGGLWQVDRAQLAWIGPATAAVAAGSMLLARHLDLLALGDADARRLGLRVGAAGPLVLGISCLLTSLAVAVAGIVAFVGLVVPHAARRIVGPGHAALLPASAFLGAILVIATDTLARTAAPPNELPLTVVTSILGVPCFLLVLRSLRRRRAAA